MITLPDYRKITIRNEVDRYGFSNLLANHLSFSYAPRSFCNWLHGWIWHDVSSAYELGCHDVPYDTRIVVAKTEQKKMLNSLGYSNVYVGGLPFAYTSHTGIIRKKNSLLSFLPHSSQENLHRMNTGSKIDQSIDDYLDYLVTIKESFDEVRVCIYWGGCIDKELLDITDKITMRGLKYVFGANPYDADSLTRMRKMLDSFEFVTTSTMGSHILYAAYSGCKVSICGTYFSTNEDNEFKSLEWVKKNFLFLFYDHPKDAVDYSSWAKNEIASNKLANDELINVLGWSLNGQLEGYLRGLKSRTKSFITTKFLS